VMMGGEAERASLRRLVGVRRERPAGVPDASAVRV
jgi:hypothetical protein